MPKPPRVAGLILCRRIELRRDPLEYTLAGMVRDLRFASWPAFAPSLMAFAALQGGSGEGRMELGVTRLETEEQFYSITRWVGFADSAGLIYYEADLGRCPFLAPGRYSFALKFEDVVLTERLLDVYPTGGPR